jgi:hypothetical protein
MGSIQEMHHLKINPEVEIAFLAASYYAVVQTADAEILGLSQSVEAFVD